jgi:hypothetical protein
MDIMLAVHMHYTFVAAMSRVESAATDNQNNGMF